ncbi:hypothetical protein [Segniliparus rugosus]|uniref:Uncharacterized protein n=1 Tax=Segniliparus rugosus (strain ATCC BAA-974 / DSM 45345 / CCUG 50838 / CIP 108380 / JCM 13579 / CDC 945) TaxID=679197 RepID=E5XL68_SEGRC|nr:hypothetical protein [Segniliparus rugosus]EFV14936.1 hypothetical protein HMPREF9336_00237 [Segniliparus rugosus ATCC BAA-974]
MAEDQSWSRIVASLNEQNARTRGQFDRTRLVADRLWELWAGEAATLFGAEWELADGRARALLDEELAILALLPAADSARGAPQPPSGTADRVWTEVELFELMEHAAAHFQAQEEELKAALAGRDELIGQAERHLGEDGSGYAAEHRLWLKRAQDVALRLAKLGAGVRAAREAYARADRMNARMFRADLFAETQPERSEAASAAADAAEQAGLYGHLSPVGLYLLADVLVAANEDLLKALIAAALALEGVGPLAGRKEREWAEQYDLRSQAVFLLAGDCLRAMGLLTRSVRQAGRNWEITEWGAGGGRGFLPDAAKVKEVVEMRIAPPPSALGQAVVEPDGLRKAGAVWRALAESVDTLDRAVVAASGFDSEEGAALESAVGQIAARLCAVQDGAAEIAELCAKQRAWLQLPWWRRSRFRAAPIPT